MQVKKDMVYNKIIKVAMDEFLINNFSKANMRTIAKRSKISLSNIYNYFISKDEIFCELLDPAVKSLEKLLITHNHEENLSIDIFFDKELQKQQAEQLVEIISEFRDELFILFFKSSGSTLEGFREKYIEANTKKGMEYMNLMKRKFPTLNVKVSDFFIHTSSSGWINHLGELIMHNFNKKELKQFINEYLEFSTAGWKQLMKI